MLLKIAAFKTEHKLCRVPKNHPADPKLSRWVASQRKYKKRLDTGDPRPKTTAERVAKLDALGFEWSPPPVGGGRKVDEAGWEAMRAKLAAFKAERGHCRVLAKHPADPQLGTWVEYQRMYKKMLDAGYPRPCITAERVAKLEALGFEWDARKRKR